MKIIRAKELTMPLTAGEEANCTTEQWALRIRREGHIHPESPWDRPARGGAAPAAKRASSGHPEQADKGRRSQAGAAGSESV